MWRQVTSYGIGMKTAITLLCVSGALGMPEIMDGDYLPSLFLDTLVGHL